MGVATVPDDDSDSDGEVIMNMDDYEEEDDPVSTPRTRYELSLLPHPSLGCRPRCQGHTLSEEGGGG